MPPISLNFSDTSMNLMKFMRDDGCFGSEEDIYFQNASYLWIVLNGRFKEFQNFPVSHISILLQFSSGEFEICSQL